MNTLENKTPENKNQSVVSERSHKSKTGESTFQFADNRPETIVQRKLKGMTNNSPETNHFKTMNRMAQSQNSTNVIQRMKNTTPAPGKYRKQVSETQDQFRLRMKAEMDEAQQSATKDDYSQLSEKQLTKIRSDREKELDNLRSGNLDKGQVIEADKTVGGTTITKSELGHKSIRDGATKGSTDFSGGKGIGKGGSDLKVKTLGSGNIGTLENGLQNPYTLQPHDTGGHSQRPRQGLAARQQSVMATAKKADRFMNTLDAGGDLSATHAKAKNQTTGSGNLKGGFNTVGNKVRANGSAEDIHGYGANEFGNKPDNRPSGLATSERLLPDITNHPGGTDVNGVQSRVGRWSEADVDPQILAPHASGNASKFSYGPRNSERLLHTASGTQVHQPDGSSAPIDYRFHVTSDHYESAVPVTPIQTDYKATHPYNSPYSDPSGKKNSFQIHKEAENERLRSESFSSAQNSTNIREAHMAAILSGENREKSETERTDQLVKLDSSARAKAHADAMASSQKREQTESQRIPENQPQVSENQQVSTQQSLLKQENLKKQMVKSSKRAQKAQNRARQKQMKWQTR